jgi:hypothetical protein
MARDDASRTITPAAQVLAMAIEKPHLADAAAALLIGREQPERQAFADDIMLGLLLLGRQLVAFPVVGGRTLLRLLKLALLHELEEAASLSIRPRRAAALLCSSGHRALLRYASSGNDHSSASFHMDMAGLLDEPMRRVRITQATKPCYPPVILRVSKELCSFWRGELKRRRGLACRHKHETVALLSAQHYEVVLRAPGLVATHRAPKVPP